MDDVIVTQKSRIEDVLVELSLYEDSEKELNVVLISEDEELKKLNYFIFNDVPHVNYYTMDEPYDKDLSILSTMDIIIFNKNNNELENLILENIIQKHPSCKFISLVNDKNHRKIDLLKKYSSGVSKVIKLESELEEYIFEIQKELKSYFYFKRLAEVDVTPIMTEKKEFEKRINELVSKKICFTKLRYHYDSDMDIFEYNLTKILRDRDTIYIDREKHEIFFILLDIMPEKADSIIKSRIKNFSIRISEISHKSVFDIVYSN